MALKKSLKLFLFFAVIFVQKINPVRLSQVEKFFFGRSGCCFSHRTRTMCLPSVLNEDYTLPVKDKRMHVRVLLDQKEERDAHLWNLRSAQPLKIICVRSNCKEQIFSTKDAKFSVRYGQLHINNKRCHVQRLNIIPVEGEPIHFNSNQYGGSFSIFLHEGKIDLINSLDIEDYVSCVLRTESWPGWPVEVNKVLAVACRTYVVSKVLEGKRQRVRTPYHIKNTNIHQTYSGLHEFPSLKKATKETEGIIMTHNHEPIVAMFDACCGGIIPAGIEDIDFSRVPYLKREYPCTYCASCSLYKYKSEYSFNEIQRLLKQQGIDVGILKNMKIHEKDKAGVVKHVLVSGDRSQEMLSKHKVYALCKKIKSFAFDIRKTSTGYIFDGYGFGHHLGLCQWGAKAMVDRGFQFKDILKFYYPNIQFKKIVYGA